MYDIYREFHKFQGRHMAHFFVGNIVNMDAITIIVGVILVIIVLIVTVVNNQRVSDLQNSIKTTQPAELPSSGSKPTLVKDARSNLVPARPYYVTLDTKGARPTGLPQNEDYFKIVTNTTDDIDFIKRLNKWSATDQPMTIYLPEKTSLWKITGVDHNTQTEVAINTTYTIKIAKNMSTNSTTITTPLFSENDTSALAGGKKPRRTIMLVEAEMTGSTVSGV
jgi:hypothetical protein